MSARPGDGKCCFPFEVECRGYPSNSLPLFFSRLGAVTDMRPDLVVWSKRSRVVIIGELAYAASRGSAWVWRKYQAAARTAHTQ